MAEQMIQHKKGEKVAMQAIPTGYKQTEVGVIPEDWSVESLSQVAQITRGKFSARPRNDPKFFGGDIPFIQTGDITRSNGYDVNFSQTINELGLSVSKLFPADSLFFTIAANIGDVAIAKYPAACPDSLVVIKENGHINKRWLYHILSSKKEVFESIATSNAQLNINLEKLNPYVLGVPELEEQTAIANVLSDTDALIAGLEQLIAKKQAIKTATMQQLLTGRTRLPQFALRPDGTPKGYKSSEHGQIPEDWEVCELQDAVIFLDGQRRPIKSGERAKMAGGYPYYGASGIVGYVNDYIFDEDLILLGEDGENILSRSVPLAFQVSGKIWVNNHAHVLKPQNDFHIYFLAEYLESLDYSLFNSGTAQPKLNKKTCQRIKVIKPKYEEQTAIATILSDMDSELTALAQKLAKARDVKQGMMQQLLTGRIRLPLEVVA
ncbi:restriction endonuclease subunit S [Aeromonas sp. FDAARGOS 1405]|uniref:restriction endonuclease subunit S n=1 Tax=unclassified Aeromonas TaxID=257493 RepID=UPI001C230DE1|nr:restriction endonuclease subunit S [Aeromonas sp. FDAARGOS 1405]QXB28756.1 restriction endonuclease subunit S [Aeromonas sp. FDAARGOS 1405]